MTKEVSENMYMERVKIIDGRISLPTIALSDCFGLAQLQSWEQGFQISARVLLRHAKYLGTFGVLKYAPVLLWLYVS